MEYVSREEEDAWNGLGDPVVEVKEVALHGRCHGAINAARGGCVSVSTNRVEIG